MEGAEKQIQRNGSVFSEGTAVTGQEGACTAEIKEKKVFQQTGILLQVRAGGWGCGLRESGDESRRVSSLLPWRGRPGKEEEKGPE